MNIFKIIKSLKSFFSKENIVEAMEIVNDIKATVDEVKQVVNTPSPKSTPKKVAKTTPKKVKGKK
jgi:hypothetical protein